MFTTKLMTPVDHLFWNEKVYKPVISTYQADYTKPVTITFYDAANIKTGVHRPAIIEQQWQWEEKVNLQNSHSDLLRAAQSEPVVRFL